MITSTALSVGTRKSHNSTKRNVTLLASRFNKASARPLAVARAVPNDESQLIIAHAYLVFMAMCHTVVVNRTYGFRSALAAASGFNSSLRSTIRLRQSRGSSTRSGSCTSSAANRCRLARRGRGAQCRQFCNMPRILQHAVMQHAMSPRRGFDPRTPVLLASTGGLGTRTSGGDCGDTGATSLRQGQEGGSSQAWWQGG